VREGVRVEETAVVMVVAMAEGMAVVRAVVRECRDRPDLAH
jgi:hypothetical protein